MSQSSVSSIQEMQNSQIMRRIEDWKSRLIDLSRRNNLLYFRRTKTNLAVSTPDAETVFGKLVLRQRHLEFWLPPEEEDASHEESGRTNIASRFTSQRPTANQLVCEGLSRKDLEGALKNLNRRSLSDYRERGVRILHAAFGMLVWKEIATSEEVRSPLIMVPIELDRTSVREPFSIKVPPVEEEAVLNPALLVKLKTDYKIELPPLPEEWENQSLTNYLNSIKQVVNELGWKVEPTVEIGLFSFHKLVIYKDLDTNAEVIIQHPLVRAIAGVQDSRLVKDSLPGEEDVDKIENPAKTFQVLDADSSQRVSIHYALQGQSFVMRGPPGTGKSQTIANIMSESIAQGKSVLFVSDKMAALEVVYKRLSEVGLAHFCLELHSSKANKQEVVAELKRCLDEQLVPRKLPSPNEFEKMKALRDSLNDYVVALHQKQPNLQKSAYEVLGEISTLERVPFVSVELPNPGSLTPQKMRELEELMSHLKGVWQAVEEQDFPWRGYRGYRYNLEVRSELSTFLADIVSIINSLRIESANFSKTLGIELPLTFERVNWLITLGNLLQESPKPETSWVLNPNLDQFIAETTTLKETCDWCLTTRSRLMERYNMSIFNLSLNRSSELQQELTATSKLLNPIGLEEGQLMKKCERLLDLVKTTQILTKQWTENTQELARLFDLPAQNLTVERARQLSRIALLLFSEDKPEQRWFDPSSLEQTKEILSRAKKDYQEHNSLRNRLEQKYDDRIYEIDLDEYVRRYSGPYKSFSRFFSLSYRNDQRRIALFTRDGRVPETILNDLIDARKLKTLNIEIDTYAETVQNLLGHFYRRYETDFQRVEKTTETTSEILKLSGATSTPEKLVKLAIQTPNPEGTIKKIADALQNSLDQWKQSIKELGLLIPVNQIPTSNLPIYLTSLSKLEEWASETEKQLTILCALTKETIEPSKQEGPQNYKQLMDDLKDAENVRRKEAKILAESSLLQTKYGSRFSGLNTDWAEILSILRWTKKVQTAFVPSPIPELFATVVSHGAAAAPSKTELVLQNDAALKSLATLELRFESGLTYQGQRLQTMGLESIHERVRALGDRVDDLQIWIDFKDIKNLFSLRGLESFFNRLTAQPPPASQLTDVFHRGVYQEWINNLYKEDPRLGRFRRENHEQLITEFRTLDQELIRLAANMVIEEANSRKPQDVLIQAGDSEVNILLKEAAKKRRLMPIRNILQRIPHVLPKLKPCLLMSPISVSQFLTPQLAQFDLILFDEASQIVPEDAIGAIYRGKTLVVAGDNKQLPPTSFFQKSLIEDVDWDEMADEDVEVFDSILDECLGIGLPVKTLRWHYRSRHEDLIAFSNHQFYDDTLITFPSAIADHDGLGVKLLYVPDGIYDRGGRRDNPREAEVVSDLVFEHFNKYPHKTLGVVTFSIAQMEAVEEAIETRLKDEPEFEHFFKEDRLEGFFVKNLENVQGDERDIMLFSVGYGRDKQGQMLLNFGPLNKPGGERRLNVAVTRAREKIIIVTSIKASDIDPKATNALGVQTLHDYLNYAEKEPEASNLTQCQTSKIESLLEKNVAEEIQRMDYNIVPQVGCSGYRIDIGVIDPANPGCYLLGVECDGATYRASKSARDRDRLREQVLKQLGWRIHRVWSPAWVARRESEIRRLKEAIEQAGEPHPEKEPPKKTLFQERKELQQKADVMQVQLAGLERIGIPYKVHVLKAAFTPYVKIPISKYPYSSIQKNEFHFEANRALQSRLLAELIKEEGPIHLDYASQRLAAVWGQRRTGIKVNNAVREALEPLLKDHRIIMKGKFLWPKERVDVPVRIPAPGVPESIRPPEHIPPEEIESAMKQIAQYALGISSESLITETAKVFGFSHAGEKIKEPIRETYQKMLREKKLVSTNDTVTIS